ncbi:MAG TPA: GNAT family N-acetyltransferase [Leptospiraceae bacterium]|nr:GNAT family N-acetyltransferase [Leptospiraceae bacterium]HMW07548.1 GNAT family N-acetyltransferase [Leptospiraceae bacterium]HMX34035.1 GNAT family N-acetyltransferase [Leptospiraceae bacterium]HMY33151.1 GNAT family N-acetyltransferase [Leptospiraceae bacterium]HMZ66033.1 GNAT family N-acetyltransferase [Leptospiraceae bacterium]
MLNDEVKKYIDESVLCWLATSDKRNEPNVSPKEIFTYQDDLTILIANIASPKSIQNILENPIVCVSFINIFVQKGFKIKGDARIIERSSDRFEGAEKSLKRLFTEEFPIQSIIEISVKKIDRIQAPSYFLFPNRTEKIQIENAMRTYKVQPLEKKKPSKDIEIIEYNPSYKEFIKSLNYEWLEKYFRVEEGDILSLSNPQEYIIDKGGMIYFAKLNGMIVGTVSLLKKSDSIYELGKMAVTQNAQGFGIGRMLLEYCLDIAKKKNIKTLVLYSNTSLKAAIHLYEEYGFTEVELEKGLYERANIKMKKELF